MSIRRLSELKSDNAQPRDDKRLLLSDKAQEIFKCWQARFNA